MTDPRTQDYEEAAMRRGWLFRAIGAEAGEPDWSRATMSRGRRLYFATAKEACEHDRIPVEFGMADDEVQSVIAPSIAKAFIRCYRDNRMYQANIEWSDGSVTQGTIQPKNSKAYLMRLHDFKLGPHLEALFARAEREGVTIGKELW